MLVARRLCMALTRAFLSWALLTRALSMLLLVTLILSASPPHLRAADMQKVVQQTAPEAVPEIVPEIVPTAAAACASFSDVTEWIADITFSWTDAAEGEILSHV